MTGEERRLALDLLDTGGARLVELTAGLSPARWHFRETPEPVFKLTSGCTESSEPVE